MTGQGDTLICERCHWTNAAGSRYCARCGEPVAPQLIAELQRMYLTLTELDAQIDAGLGATTIQSLRDTLRERYFATRKAQPTAEARPAAAPMGAAPVAPPAAPAPTTVPLGQPVAAPSPARAPASAPVAAQPHGPVFSWRAFIAEQAIAVMAYLGGFLLLIATLTFEVGGWQALPDLAKLGGVLLAYLIFGALGLTLRRATSLRTVSRVYLGVFALMTPLAALAVYRFELQARGFSVAGMICLSAAYASVVYLALAARTRFVTYAYLGWAALLVAALAIPTWAEASQVWWIPITNVMALLLLGPRALRRLRGDHAPDWLDSLEPSATQISGGAGLIASVLTILTTLATTGMASSSAPQQGEQFAAVAAAACALVPLTIAWSWAARTVARLADNETTTALDLYAFASAPVAATAVANWLHATPAAFVYTLTAVAGLEALAAETLRWRANARRGLRIGVQVLAATLAAISALLGIGVTAMPIYAPNYALLAPNYGPVIVACVVGLALALVFALRGSQASVISWGLLGGAFLLIGAQETFSAAIPHTLLYSGTGRLPDGLVNAATLFAILALALVVLALGLHAAATVGSNLRRLRAPIEITALAAAFVSLFFIQILGHGRDYSALLLGAFALAALVVARVERRPVAAGGFVGGFGALAAAIYLSGNLDGVAVAATPIALALATLALRRLLGHVYSVPVYIVALLATLIAFLQLEWYPFETTVNLTFLSLSVAGWMALAVALALVIDTLLSRSPLTWLWMAAPAIVTLLGVVDARILWARLALTLALAGVGALLRWLRGEHTELAWHGAALCASLVTLAYATLDPQHPAEYTLGTALLFALVAYAIAWQERQPWVSTFAIPYALVALVEAGALAISPTRQMIVTLALALAAALAGMAARHWLGRAWALAPYAFAVSGVIFTATRVTPYPERAGLLEAILLVFAALAFFAALLEETPWAALAPAAFAVAAALVQPDGRALLPLALGLAAAAFAVSRTRGAVWSLPLYGAALVAAVTSAWQGRTQAGVFEVAALVALALAAWLLAALESRPDALLVAFAFAALAISASARAFAWDAWQATLAFAALAWAFELSRLGWARIPWLRERAGDWLTSLGRTMETQAAWRDPRRAGQRLTRGAAAFVGAGVVLGGWLAPQSFDTASPQTQAMAVSLLSLTLLLTRFGWGDGWRPALYLAGEALALCVTWELRWLGAANPQAWIVAPGSAQLIIGALLPADRHVHPPAWLAQAFSLAGALILMLPTLGQSITEPLDWQWRYALLLAVEALALTLLAVGLRNRLVALTGAAFVGVAAVRGAIIAVQQNLPVPIVIAVFAVALMALATWLSLRARHAAHTPTAP